MDHFNLTVQKDGALVSTRRGLQVTKHKYHGISFVNTSGPTQASGGSFGSFSATGRGRRKAAGDKAKPKAPGAATATSASSSSSTPAASGFSSFSAFSPAATPGSDAPAGTGKTNPPADPSKPLVHRWKLVPTPAAGKPKRNSVISNTHKQQQQQQLTSSDGLPSPPAPETPSSFMTALTPPESDISFPSPLITSPSSIAESTVSSGESPSKSLFAQEWEAEYISPNAAALRTSSKRSRVAAARSAKGACGAPGRLGSEDSSSSSSGYKTRKARIQALVSSSQQVDRSLPTWSTCHVPQLNKLEQRLFHQFFQLIPRKLYPFEDLLQYNPTRSSEFYWMIVQDRAAVRCVLLCGAMMRAMLSGENNSEELAQEVANVCGIVNQQLAYHQEQQQQQQRQQQQRVDDNEQQMQLSVPQRCVIPDMTLECITTLALMGGSTGRYDHWHLHMQALNKMVALNGGAGFLAEVRPALLLKMRKTDLKGAMALAIAPYLPPSGRRYANISDAVLLEVVRQHLVAGVSAVLLDAGCGVAPAVAQTLCQLCVFVHATQLTAELAKTAVPLPLDPFCFSEELYWIQYLLVSQPAPLRKAVAPHDAAAAHHAETAALCGANPLLPVDTSSLATESYVRNHRAPLAALYIVPADLTPPSTTALEPALRIGGILYLKEYIPDFPRNIGGYSILLHLLRNHLGSSAAELASLLANRSARAVLLWLCLVGDTVSRIANTNEQRDKPAEQYDRRVYRARIADLVSTRILVDGGADNGDGVEAVDTINSLPDSDWALCRLLSLGSIQALQAGGPWSDQQAVANILQEGWM